jgi:hypothetical protein
MTWASLAKLRSRYECFSRCPGVDEVQQFVIVVQAKRCFGNLYKMFLATDATLVEVNPLAETPDGRGTFEFLIFTSIC